MKLYVLDFESYWDQDYTLKKLTTDGYVLDPRFKAHGLGIRWPSGQLEWVRGPDIPAALQRIDWANAAVCAHNTAFDGFILTQRYGCPQPKWWLDTMSMARGVFGPDVSASLKEVAGRLGLGVKGDAVEQTKGLTVLPPDVEASLAEYCLNDVELCYRVLAELRSRVPAIEMKLIDLTLRMFIRPRVRLDTAMLETHLTSELKRKDELMAKLGVTKAQLNSAEQLAALFARLGVAAPTKPSPKDPKKRIFAFAKSDPEFQALLEDDRDEVRWLAEARLGVRSTIEESRTGRLLEVARADRPWPIMLNYYGAHTGRWSGGNKQNPQNLGRKSVLRQSITAPKGYVIGVVDSSQIECRMAARMAGQMDLVDTFRRGGDPYCGLASRAFRRAITKADKLERQVGKVGRLAFQYQQGWLSAAAGFLSGAITQGYGPIVFDTGAANAFGADPRWLLKPGVAERIRSIPATLPRAAVAIHALATAKFVWTYRDESPFIVDYWAYLHGLLPILAGGGKVQEPWFTIENKGVTLPNGMRIEYHGLREHDGEWIYLNRRKPVKLYGGKFLENVDQALSRIVVAEQMVRIAQRYEVATMSHDEVVFLMPEREADEGMQWALDIMHTPPRWMPDLPVAAEGGFAERYADAKS